MKFPISRWCSNLLIFGLLIFGVPAAADINDITRIYKQTPTLAQFEVCQGGGCYLSNILAITAEEWQPVVAVFNPPAQNAEQERAQIAQAIGLIEGIVGEKNGTETDRAGTFDNSDYPGQMDCNDESINTTTYLRLLKSNGLIQFHEAEDMRTRNFFFTGWPHTTAVMHELASGERFAVDSWFYDNGHAAAIVQFEQWKDNYQPEDSPVGQIRQHAAKPVAEPAE